MNNGLPSRHVSRRQFLETTGAVGAALIFGPQVLLRSAQGADATDKVLRGFIVSDAHFGWVNPKQPSVQVQAAAMLNITQRFKELDLFLDTGDAHHNDAAEAAYGDWSDVIVRGCGPLPMFFGTGNHESEAFGRWDPEEKTGRMASYGCRPYYSFDAKGIHFLVLPQLIRANCVTREALNWAALDLKLNQDKTVIVLSHNSLKGTTEPHGPDADLAYRMDANSDEVYELLNSHPQVIAWMHGHNHDFKIVPKPERVYVSNGRIGGFPALSDGVPDEVNKTPHLGGIYFEVHPDRFVVRCYSATEEKFFDEMPGCAHLSYERSLATSYDVAHPFRVSYGNGNLLDGLKMPIYQYHAGTAARSLFFAPLENAAFNDNTRFSAYGKRPTKNNDREGGVMMPGYDVNALKANGRKSREDVFTWDNPGITVQPTDGGALLTAPGARVGLDCYYRVSPGQKVEVRVQFGQTPAGAKLAPRLMVASNDQKIRATVEAPPTVLRTNDQTVSFAFAIPADAGKETIYTDAAKDLLLSAWFELGITNLPSPLEIKKLEMLVQARGNEGGHELIVNGEKFAFDGTMVPRALKPAASPREYVEARIAGSGRGVFLVQETPEWQARNAPLTMHDGALQIAELRNEFSPKRDVLLAPLRKTNVPFVHRLGGLAPAVVQPYDPKTKTITVEFPKINGPGEVEFVCAEAPLRVEGAADSTFREGRLLVRVSKPGKLQVEWA